MSTLRWDGLGAVQAQRGGYLRSMRWEVGPETEAEPGATGATVSISVFILSRMEDVGGF